MTANNIFNSEGSLSRDTLFVAKDPRFLIVIFGFFVLFTFAIPGTSGLVLLLSYLVVLHRLCGLSFKALLQTLRSLSLFLLLILAINAFLVKGTPLPGPLSFLSHEGMVNGIYYGLRVLVLYLAVVMFLALTSQEEIARGLSTLIRPLSPTLARRVAFYGFLSVGFLPLFADEVRRIRVAQRFRGGGFEGGFLRKLASVRLLLVPLILSAIHRSGQLAMAVEIRGIRSSIGELIVPERPTYRDFVFAGVTMIVLFVAFLIR